jgi:phage RecT family recombinase
MAKKPAVQEANPEEKSDLEIMEAAAAKKGELVTMAPSTQNYIRQIMTEELVKSLSRPEIFERNLFNALAANQALIHYPPFYLYREVSKAAALNLLLDPLLGEAYLIEAYDGKKKRKIPQLRIGYKGMLKLARMPGSVAGIWCHEIYEKDKITVDLGHPKVFHHEPKLFVDRGAIIGYAAVIAFKDGSFDFEPMSLEECLKIRDRSDAYKAFKGGFIKSTPWETDQNEMCKKTTLRRLMKRQDTSPQLRDAIAIEDAAEFPHMVEHVAAAPEQPKIKAPTPPPDEIEKTVDGAIENRMTDARQKTTKTAKAKEKFEKLAGKELIDFAKQCCDTMTKEIVAKNPDVIDDLWNKALAPHLEDAFPPDVSEVQGIFNKMVARLSP